MDDSQVSSLVAGFDEVVLMPCRKPQIQRLERNPLLLVFALLILLIGHGVVLGGDGPVKKLSDVEKAHLEGRLGAVQHLIELAVNEARNGNPDASKAQLSLCVRSVIEVASHFEKPAQYFAYGTTLGSLVDSTAGNDALTATLIRDFIPLVHVKELANMYQGLQLVLLQRYYHMQDWQHGKELIVSLQKDAIVPDLLVREVAGFCGGIISIGRDKGGCDIYAELLANKSALSPSLDYGQALMNLAHLYASAKEYEKTVDVFNSISNKSSGFYETNLATISYFRYAAYQRLNDQTNMLVQVALAAKAANQHPEWVSEDVVRQQLPQLISEYQAVGFIDKKLVPVLSSAKRRNNASYTPRHQTFVLGVFIFTTLVLAYFLLRKAKHNGSEGNV